MRAYKIHGNSEQIQNEVDTNDRDITRDIVHVRYWGELPYLTKTYKKTSRQYT
jgi:hypothetical protein